MALRFPCPLARNERTGPLAGKERSGNSCSYNGGGRGIYCNVDGDLPGAPRTEVPGQAAGDLPVASAATCGGFDSFQEVHTEGGRREEGTVAPTRAGENSEHPMLDGTAFSIFFVNIRGLLSHLAELTAALRILEVLPGLVCLNETFLDTSVEDITLESYELVARRDRDDGRKCGGVAVFVHESVKSRVTLLSKSATSERVWLVLHADVGPFLIGVWYRPPEPGETGTIKSLEDEWGMHSKESLGTILVGDMNVHHRSWLRHSSRNSVEGEALRTFCDSVGLRQIVKVPTRGEHLLDLLITDLDETKCKVIPKIADHSGLLATLPLPVPKSEILTRTVWQFRDADWDGLKGALTEQSWTWLEHVDAHEGAQRLTELILGHARRYIPQRCVKERKTTHPWVNDRVIELVRLKREAEGSEHEAVCRDRCSAGILEEYGKYVIRERAALKDMPQCSKPWWSKSRRLMQKKGIVSSIPALRDSGKWVLDACAKADLFVATLSGKYTLAAAEVNAYTDLEPSMFKEQAVLADVTEKGAEEVLSRLREDSGTGPDCLPARILKYCAKELAKPVQLLTLLIIATGAWPEMWLQHWVAPLFKKKNVYDPANYRGIHLTAQLSKVVERLLKALFVPFITSTVGYGPNQFAYTTGRGARDALATLVLTWVEALARGRKIGIYCSDVSGAFDRVSVDRLVAKLQAPTIHQKVISVLTSWLRQRTAHVVVGGKM